MSFEPSDQEEDAAETPQPPSRAARWLLALVACLVVLAMVLTLLPLTTGPQQPEVRSGIVTSVAADGLSVCMDLEPNGEHMCPDIFQLGNEPIVVGQRLTGELIRAHGGTSSAPLLLVTSVGPSP